MRGRQNKRVPLRLRSRLSLALPGRRAGSPASRGRSPGGPEPRAPRFPSGPPGPLPRPRPAGPRPRALGLPVPGDPAVLSPRRAARSAWVAGGPRARAHPPASGNGSRGRLGNRRREAATAAALRTPPHSGFLFFFLPILMGRKVTAYFAFINSHHNNKNPGANSGQRARSAAAGGGGDGRQGPPGLRPPLERRTGTPGRGWGGGRRPKMSSDAGSVSFALLLLPQWRSEARARRPPARGCR